MDVSLQQNDEERWMAIASLADEPDIGIADELREAIEQALAALGEPYASEMAGSAVLDT